jgi:hypothetical protein
MAFDILEYDMLHLVVAVITWWELAYCSLPASRARLPKLRSHAPAARFPSISIHSQLC